MSTPLRPFRRPLLVLGFAALALSVLFVKPPVGPNPVFAQTESLAFSLGQDLGANVGAAAMADLDHDDDPDLVLARTTGPAEVWLNEAGTFQDSGLRLGTDVANGVAVGDLNGDRDPDIFI